MGRPLCKRRTTEGAFYTTIPNLIRDRDDSLPTNRKGTFRNYFRMDEDEFNTILRKVQPSIEKENTRFRESISPDQRVMVTLQYLATGAN